MRADKWKNGGLFGLLLVLAWSLSVPGLGQEMPPRPMGASFIRNLNFGAFSTGLSGGTIILDPSGSRTSMGDILLLDYGYLYFPALFELEGNPGTVIHFLAGPPAVLAGDHGGSLTMEVGNTEPSTPFILPLVTNGVLEIAVGGTLSVGGPLANPAGEYSGQFYVMFIQE